MAGRLIGVARSAYQYPLLIKQLLHAPMVQTPDQEIVYRDLRRLTYADLRDRIGRLANGLKMLGVRPGDTVGVMDWDSNRFLEAFFAIPMMGAILQTVNVRLVAGTAHVHDQSCGRVGAPGQRRVRRASCKASSRSSTRYGRSSS